MSGRGRNGPATLPRSARGDERSTSQSPRSAGSRSFAASQRLTCAMRNLTRGRPSLYPDRGDPAGTPPHSRLAARSHVHALICCSQQSSSLAALAIRKKVPAAGPDYAEVPQPTTTSRRHSQGQDVVPPGRHEPSADISCFSQMSLRPTMVAPQNGPMTGNGDDPHGLRGGTSSPERQHCIAPVQLREVRSGHEHAPYQSSGD